MFLINKTILEPERVTNPLCLLYKKRRYFFPEKTCLFFFTFDCDNEFMIHNNSSDTVLIKKISLKLWSLRDEIEARIQQKIDAGEISAEDPKSIELNLKSIQAEYVRNVSNENVIPFKSNTEEVQTNLSNEEVEALSQTDENEADLSKIAGRSQVIPEEKIAIGKTVLSEIGMDRMLFFSNRVFTEGQSIVIEFCIPKTFTINADVMYCRPFNFKSRIISKNNFTHRMLVNFTFLKDGERALLREFLQSIEPERAAVSASLKEVTENS